MTKSKFREWVILPVALSTIAIATSFILAISDEQMLNSDTPIFFIVFFSAFFIYFMSMLVFGELRTKAVKIYIGNSSIAKKSFLGLGLETTYNFSDLSGYKTSKLSSKNGTYEVLYVMSGDKKVIKLSEFYHSNYKELKADLMRKNLKSLGVEYWSFIRETKEIFT